LTDSPTEAAQAAAPAATEAKDVASPAPSTGETKGVETSYLDRVTAALGEGKAESPAATDGKETKPPPVATGDVKKADELGPDDDTGTYPRTAQGRIRHLADQVKTTKAENARLAESAKLSDQLVDFMEEKGIAPEELDNILKLTALIKGNDNEGALKVLAPIYRRRPRAAGEAG
jgi:hypothetical protein